MKDTTALEYWKRIGTAFFSVVLTACVCIGGAGRCFAQGVSDNFTIPANLILNADGVNGTVGIWSVVNAHLATGGQPPTAGTIDIGITTADRLTMIPANVPPPDSIHNGWYSDNQGPLVYQTVAGNFIVMANVTVRSASNPNLAPRGQFNAAGFLIRSPQSPIAPADSTGAAPAGQQNWVMFNIGFQLGDHARELKFTRSPQTPEDPSASPSAIYLDPVSTSVDESGNVLALSAQLLLCRVGPELRAYRAVSGQWVAESTPWDGMSMPSNLYLFPPVMDVSAPYFLSPDGTIQFPLPAPDENDALQVGLMANSWNPSPDGMVAPETQAEFQSVQFSSILPNNLDECTSLMPVQMPVPTEPPPPSSPEDAGPPTRVDDLLGIEDMFQRI